MKIAFVSYRKQEKYSVGSPKDEDKVLMALFKEKELDVEEVIWNDPKVDWKRFKKAIIKSPWDYHEFFSEFELWLDRMDDMGIELLNTSSIIRWNIDKHYLKDIQDSGLDVIPFLFLEKNAKPDLGIYFSRFKTEQLVVKPCVSASARNTLRVSRDNVLVSQQQLHSFLEAESFIIQPFIKEISEGEISFIFLGGKYSHSVIKLPKSGDFRVQHFHGGTIRVYEPEQAQIQAAKKFVDEHAKGTLYARVDGIMVGTTFQLMELELIEPYLFLDTSPGAYQRYYEALIQVLKLQ